VLKLFSFRLKGRVHLLMPVIYGFYGYGIIEQTI
jgi:hypothetical protein